MSRVDHRGGDVPLIDLTPDFLRFWNEARDCPPAEQQRLWSERYEAVHRDLFALTEGRHGNPEHLPVALARFPAIAPALPGVVAQVQETIGDLTPALCNLFDLAHLDLRWVLLVGMFWADGWVVDVDGTPTCFIAVEHLVDVAPLRARLLLGHEAAHVAHAACPGAAWDELETLGHHLFLEGLAIAATAHLLPGLAPATYTWLGLEHTPRGLSLDTWTAQCEAAWISERDEFLPYLFSADRAAFARYFLQAPPVTPERLGYWVSWRVLAELRRQYSFAELARWSPQEIHEHLRTTAVLS